MNQLSPHHAGDGSQLLPAQIFNDFHFHFENMQGQQTGSCEKQPRLVCHSKHKYHRLRNNDTIVFRRTTATDGHRLLNMTPAVLLDKYQSLGVTFLFQIQGALFYQGGKELLRRVDNFL